MFHKIAYMVAIVVGLACGMQVMAGSLGGRHHACPGCGATGNCCYKAVTVTRCKMVPDNHPIKKVVYEMREVPYCAKKLTHGHCDCEQCRACANHKRVLVKREITCGEKCGTKCVPEEVTEWVAVPCCKCGYNGHCSGK